MSRKLGSGLIDISGNRYGKLIVIGLSGRNKHGQTTWHCKCDCENELPHVDKHALTKKKANTRSCGCLNLDKIRERNFRHGFASRNNPHPMFKVWMGIKARCNIPSTTHWDRYGGRGIKVEWKSFEEFYRDMGAEYEKLYKGKRSTSIERINNDGNYCRENCRWANDKEQANNKSTNHLLTHNGKTQTLTQWAEEVGSTQERIRARLKIGYSIQDALSSGRYNLRPETIKKMQARSNRVRLTLNGKTLTLKQWSEETGLRTTTLYDRYHKGWPVEKILTERYHSEMLGV